MRGSEGNERAKDQKGKSRFVGNLFSDYLMTKLNWLILVVHLNIHPLW